MTIYEKLLEVQKEIKPIVKDSKNPHFKNTYFDINTLLEAVKPVLNKHELVLTQALTNIGGKMALETMIASPKERWIIKEENRPDGSSAKEYETASIKSTCPLPECADAQKYGSAITYFRRYALQSLLALEAEDDDGEGSKGTGFAGKSIISDDDEI